MIPATRRIVDFFIWWAVRDLNPRPPACHAGTRLARQACQLSDLPIGPSFRVSRHKGKCKSVTPFFQVATQMATRKDRHDEKAEYIQSRFTVLRQSERGGWWLLPNHPPLMGSVGGYNVRLGRSRKRSRISMKPSMVLVMVGLCWLRIC